jgi:hypothetical protein
MLQPPNHSWIVETILVERARLTRPKLGRSAAIGGSLPRTLYHGGAGGGMRETRERPYLCATGA